MNEYYVNYVKMITDNNTGKCIIIEKGRQGVGVRIYSDNDQFGKFDINIEDEMAKLIIEAISQTINEEV